MDENGGEISRGKKSNVTLNAVYVLLHDYVVMGRG